MSTPPEQTLAEAEAEPASEEEEDAEEEEQSEQSEEWETMARAWVSSFPEAKAVSMEEVEAWIDSNFDFIPDGIKSMPRSDVCQRLIAIQNCMRSAAQEKENEKEEEDEEEEGQGDTNIPARFQRTDQWRPVYSWLESLDRDDVVKSEDISEWLTSNPEIQEYLCSRHTRYHMMHYVKKCHMKILKRRERKKGVQQSDTPAFRKVHKDVEMKQEASPPSTSLINVPQDSDLYEMKRKEALEKFQILVELEKLLTPTFLKHGDGNK